MRIKLRLWLKETVGLIPPRRERERINFLLLKEALRYLRYYREDGAFIHLVFASEAFEDAAKVLKGERL